MSLSDKVLTENRDRPMLSVVTPCYNESEVVKLFYDETKPVLGALPDLDYEIIFVDDGSSDDTLIRLNELAGRDETVRVCSLSRNFGHQIALTAGLDFALGDAIILMDCDLQHPPRFVPELVAKWREGYDVVAGVRANAQGASWLKNFTSSGFYTIFNLLSSTRVPKGAADFCLLSRRVCNTLKNMPERHRLLRGMVFWTGFKTALVSSRPESDLFGPLSRLIILTFFGGANLFQWFPSFFASKPPEALWRRHQYASSTLHLN